MSVRRRSWVTRKGEKKTAWMVDYVDQFGARHVATFASKKDADDYCATDWIAGVELEGRERATVAQYRQHANRHIRPRLGRERQHPVSRDFAMIFCCT
jgi:integrase